MRVAGWVTQRSIQFIELFIGHQVLAAICFIVDLVQWHAGFIDEIALPQSMCAHNVDRPTFTFGCEMELRALRLEQPLRLHVSDETRHFHARQVQGPSQ